LNSRYGFLAMVDRHTRSWTFEEVQDNTGFALERIEGPGETAAPTTEQLDVLERLDPHDLRATVFKGNPPGRRAE